MAAQQLLKSRGHLELECIVGDASIRIKKRLDH
jgi:hypothetical protein